jgi:thiol-disulfide isomerase/thioredoxin
MRGIALLSVSLISLHAAETSAGKLWFDLKAKRESLPGFHQEFDVTRTTRSASGNQSMKYLDVIDISQGKWRERQTTGSGMTIRIFDGVDVLTMEEGGDEYIRVKRDRKETPKPRAYADADADWSKAVERDRRPCGIPGVDHQCVTLEAPIKPDVRASSAGTVNHVVKGADRAILDLETGVMLALSTVEGIVAGNRSYELDFIYTSKRLGYGAAGAALFELPSPNLREVKEFTRWNASRIKKELGGKAAPEFSFTALDGSQLSLAGLKGKTVLLDFWTTWCGPCRADGPSLDKLFAKYKEKDLVIIGVSVSEDRPIVEKFLHEHPHSYPVVLTTENEMPRPYQIGVFPTYIVINPDGSLSSAVQDTQGFGELRKILKKAGLEVE